MSETNSEGTADLLKDCGLTLAREIKESFQNFSNNVPRKFKSS